MIDPISFLLNREEKGYKKTSDETIDELNNMVFIVESFVLPFESIR